ncbi:T9SS type B sorting domain-containing protein [Neptunitalea lumnitzerae]|uniref:Gliding motility-associated C-terminal domain-containing protein n=1 Tax=Neptunitalea lumnitzerae TaxID=2965509 RepID=A0ABQ5MKK8_9FLAO|nr:gliding motility-associated C-terminal domain-containing protein [Neptunitalea sp. Y10]GLB49941.1 hypothetical protein Y10_23090 [Neptunitalea sp. Y10]
MDRIKKLLFPLIFLQILWCNAQSSPISLYTQFNGRYDYTTIGNTLNTAENNSTSLCSILTSSSADFVLNPGDSVHAAYLYWAGSGSGDFSVTLNGQAITAQRTFTVNYFTRTFFSAFADVTTQVQNTGTGTYLLSDLDLTNVIASDPIYCNTSTNFGGWAIVIVLENNTYPLRQVNIYDGLENVPSSVDILLDNLDVYDTQGAKIGFLAWEGDSLLATESLTINGTVVENLPTNPGDNAFNGTNAFTGATNLYNMDIDYYNLENYISVNDTSLAISLSSLQDFVMVNNIVTVLNSYVIPDASVIANNTTVECDSRFVSLDFAITNYNTSGTLPQGTEATIYVNSTYLDTVATTTNLLPGTEEYFTQLLNIPLSVGDNFTITIIVDENNNLEEFDETNNTTEIDASLIYSPTIPLFNNLESCDIGFNTAQFDLTEANTNAQEDLTFSGFYLSELDAEGLDNPILTPTTFTSTEDPQLIYYRYDNANCYTLGSFELTTTNCPPIIPQGFSPNGDIYNETFNIQGLWNVFEKFELKIYNRYGTLVYEGNENTTPWDGIANCNTMIGEKAPTGTYFYILKLEDELYNLYTGWVYLNR